MTDDVTTQVLVNDGDRYVLHITNISDSTGEAAVAKVDKSTLTAVNGREPIALDVVKIEGTVFGFPHILLEWDHGTNDTLAVLAGGYVCLDWRRYGALRDPTINDGTGDILLTTGGTAAANEDTYDLTLELRLRPDD